MEEECVSMRPDSRASMPTKTTKRSSSRFRWGSIAAVFGLLGPGLIAANAGNDAGGIVTYASAGAQFGYATLFLMLLVTVALVVVQEMSARLGACTGEGLVSLFREHFSLRSATFAVAMLLIANLCLVVSEFAGIGAALGLLGVAPIVSIPISAILLWSLIVFGSYRYAERIFLFLGLAFLAYPVAAFLSRPHWSSVATHLVIPHFPRSSAFLFVAVALIGTTITPYMQLYQAAAVVDRGSGSEQLRSIRADSITGSAFANIISMFIIIATAAAIGGKGPLGSAKEAASALQPVAGHYAVLLFAVGLLGASALAAAVVPLSTSYAVCEGLGLERSVSSSFRKAPVFMGFFTAQIFFGAAIALIPGNLIDLLMNMQVLNGVITPIILGFILALANKKSVLGANANGPILRIFATTCVVVVGVLALIVSGQTIQGLITGS